MMPEPESNKATRNSAVSFSKTFRAKQRESLVGPESLRLPPSHVRTMQEEPRKRNIFWNTRSLRACHQDSSRLIVNEVLPPWPDWHLSAPSQWVSESVESSPCEHMTENLRQSMRSLAVLSMLPSQFCHTPRALEHPEGIPRAVAPIRQTHFAPQPPTPAQPLDPAGLALTAKLRSKPSPNARLANLTWSCKPRACFEDPLLWPNLRGSHRKGYCHDSAPSYI